jgi:hypothetical protein
MIKGTATIRDIDLGMIAMLRRLRQDVSQVKIGVHPDEEQTLLIIAGANEFGATINHPGGTPFVIGKDGKAKFVSISRGGAVAGFTKPHKITIPARSFIRTTIDENQEEYQKIAATLLTRVLDGNLSLSAALELIGQKVESDIKRKMVTLKNPPNKASTIRKKKSENPLIDKGTLLNSIRYVVE